jgi:hypothetical protein
MTRVLEGIVATSGTWAAVPVVVFDGVLAALPLPATALVLSILMAAGLVSAVQRIGIELRLWTTTGKLPTKT